MEERIAVLEISELPGKESSIDCAFFLGSSAGTSDAERKLGTDVVNAGRVRAASVGRSREAPKSVSYCPRLQLMPKCRSNN